MKADAPPRREERIFGIVTRLLTKRGHAAEFQAEQPLEQAGLTSLDMVNLMLAVEIEFDLEIPQREITPENFRSVAAIGRLVEALVPTA
jgi:acyl carrier protein